MNKVIISGRWVKDTELKFTPGSGKGVLTGTIACDRSFKNAEGEKEADFIPVVIWGKGAENTANFCGKKGDKISIVGRIQTRQYDAKDGSKRYVTEVVAEETEWLNSKPSGQAPSSGGFSSNYDYMQPVEDDGQIPF